MWKLRQREVNACLRPQSWQSWDTNSALWIPKLTLFLLLGYTTLLMTLTIFGRIQQIFVQVLHYESLGDMCLISYQLQMPFTQWANLIFAFWFKQQLGIVYCGASQSLCGPISFISKILKTQWKISRIVQWTYIRSTSIVNILSYLLFLFSGPFEG